MLFDFSNIDNENQQIACVFKIQNDPVVFTKRTSNYFMSIIIHSVKSMRTLRETVAKCFYLHLAKSQKFKGYPRKKWIYI